MKITFEIRHGSGIYAIVRLSLISRTRRGSKICPPCCSSAFDLSSALVVYVPSGLLLANTVAVFTYGRANRLLSSLEAIELPHYSSLGCSERYSNLCS